MSTKTRRILSIIALALMLVFTIFFVISLYNSTLLGGTLLYFGIAAGVGGVVLYILIMRDNRLKNDQEIINAMKEKKLPEANEEMQTQGQENNQK